MKIRYPLRAIVIDATPERAEEVVATLRDAGYAVQPHYIDCLQGLEAQLQEDCDIIFIGDSGGIEIESAVATVKRLRPELPVLAVMPGGSTDGAGSLDQALAYGATDLVCLGHSTAMLSVVARELAALTERRDLRQLRRALTRSDRQFRTLMAASREPIAMVRDRRIVEANHAFLDLLGYPSAEELQAIDILQTVTVDARQGFAAILEETGDADDRPLRIEVSLLKSNHLEQPVAIELRLALLDGVPCMQVVAREIASPPAPDSPSSEARRLTPLGDRDSAVRAISRALYFARATGIPSALLYLEVNDFTTLRACVGLLRADQLIEQIGLAALRTVGSPANVARYQDDAFTIVLHGTEQDDATILAQKLVSELASTTVDVGGTPARLSVRIGIATIENGSLNAIDALEQAHSAARSAGEYSRRVRVHLPSAPGLPVSSGTNMRQIIEHALASGGLRLVFQPIVNLRGERDELYEVFLRMHDDHGEAIAPEVFFPAARTHGIINRLDSWIVDNALRVLAERRQDGHPTSFFVKLSSEAMRQIDTPVRLARRLAQYSVAEHLVIEVSESAASRDIDNALAFMESLHKLHCRTALEHFGGGLISSRLMEIFPVDFVKLDAALTSDIRFDRDKDRAVRTLIQEAKSAKKTTIAECVEDAESLVALYDTGVDFVQGHYFQAPRSELDFDFPDEMSSPDSGTGA